MNLRDFVGIIRELSFSEIRHEAMIPPRVLLVATSWEQADAWRSDLFGRDAATFVDLVTPESGEVNPLAFDVIVSIGELDRERSRSWVDLCRRAGEEIRLVEVDDRKPASHEHLERVRRWICDVCRDRTVSLGRYIDEMRHAATSEIVADTSRVNAQFAAISNVPAMIPVVGSVFAAGADFLVLTKNQLMMMYRLAAIYDRDLDDRFRIYTELAPVVGAGLLWRTAARQIAAVLPFALGAIPKVAIAYTGTYAVGQAARLYYEHGCQLNAEEFGELYREAISVFESARGRIAGVTEPPPEPIAAEGRSSA